MYESKTIFQNEFHISEFESNLLFEWKFCWRIFTILRFSSFTVPFVSGLLWYFWFWYNLMIWCSDNEKIDGKIDGVVTKWLINGVVANYCQNDGGMMVEWWLWWRWNDGGMMTMVEAKWWWNDGGMMMMVEAEMMAEWW